MTTIKEAGPCFDPGHAVAAFAGIPCTRERFTMIEDVLRERMAQDTKWGEQNHPDGTGLPGDANLATFARQICDDNFRAGIGAWRDILAEEVGEAFAETDPAALRKELVQVAAVACAWVEAIDRRSA